MYSDEVDAEGLHGPSGPLDLVSFQRYPFEEQAAARDLILRLGFSSLQEFADDAIPPPKQHLFGGGLTHEVSSFIAAANLEGQIAAGPRAGSFVWDAVGNAARYKRWIDLSLNAGFDIALLYVQCPLAVALQRAARRARKVTPDVVRATHAKAIAAFGELFPWVENHKNGYRIAIEVVNTSDEAEYQAAVAQQT